MSGLPVPNTQFTDGVTRVISEWLNPVNDAMNFACGLVGLNDAGVFQYGGLYVVNDYVVYANQLYKCIAPIAPAVLAPDADPTHWALLANLNRANITQLANVAQLRAAGVTSVLSNTVYLHGYYSATLDAAPDGGGGFFVYDAADTTSPDNGGTIIVDAAGRRWYRQYSSQVDARWFGAKIDNTTDDTTALQAWINAEIYGVTPSLFLPAGEAKTGPLTWNGASQPPNDEWQEITTIYGEGRFNSRFTATGTYAPGDYIITGNNFAGVSIRNLGVDGLGIADSGLNLQWIGGSGGDPFTSPSCNNVLENVFVQGCPASGVQLDQFHDSKISGLWIRGVDAAGTALSLQGAGGQIVGSDIWVGSGLVKLASQNGSFDRCGFFGGLQLTGAGYNHFAFNGVHLYADPANGTAINSTAFGNATRGCVFNGCYVNPCTYVVSGHWHEGATFIGCGFQAWTAFADNAHFTPAGGSGSPPVFVFINCSFESAVPASQAGLYNVVLLGCRTNTGVVATDYGNIYASGSFTSAALKQQFGSAAVYSNGAQNLAAGGTVAVTAGRGTFILSVSNYSTASADHCTHTTYHCSLTDADASNQVIQLATNNGSGGSATFAISFPSSNSVLVTNTSGFTTTLTVSLFGTGR